MATSDSATNPFQAAFENLRKATMSALQMQQDMYGQWARMWPGFTPPQNNWTSGMQKAQRDWAKTVTEMMQKHREMLDQQYRAGIESLEDAFRVAGSKDPEELRARCEALCRNALNLMKETSEQQMKQFQEAMTKWIELCQTKP